MSRETSPFEYGGFWLDKRRDGKSPDIWQIARYDGSTILYRSTKRRTEQLEDAKNVLIAHAAAAQAKGKQDADSAMVAPLLVLYWEEHGKNVLRPGQVASSLRQFIGFMLQDDIGAMATVAQLTPTVFTRFRKWRMGPHEYSVPWEGETFDHKSNGVAGESVQRNIDDIRAALHHHEEEGRITVPRIKSVPKSLRSPPRDLILTVEQLGSMFGYARALPDKELFQFMALMLATCGRSEIAALFDPARQYNRATGIIDLHPANRMRSHKRNALVPAIDEIKPVLAAWADAGAKPVKSRKKAWRTMRTALELPAAVLPTTIRHTVATMLRNDPDTPTHLVDEFMGHVDLDATTQRYAKLSTKYLAGIKPGLAKIWNAVMGEADRWLSDHSLTTPQRGIKLSVVPREGKC